MVMTRAVAVAVATVAPSGPASEPSRKAMSPSRRTTRPLPEIRPGETGRRKLASSSIVEMNRERQGHGVPEEQPGPEALCFYRQCLQPTEHGWELAAAQRAPDALLGQACRPLVVGRGERVAYCPGD